MEFTQILSANELKNLTQEQKSAYVKWQIANRKTKKNNYFTKLAKEEVKVVNPNLEINRLKTNLMAGVYQFKQYNNDMFNLYFEKQYSNKSEIIDSITNQFLNGRNLSDKQAYILAKFLNENN
jgi:hypothetical protein